MSSAGVSSPIPGPTTTRGSRGAWRARISASTWLGILPEGNIAHSALWIKDEACRLGRSSYSRSKKELERIPAEPKSGVQPQDDCREQQEDNRVDDIPTAKGDFAIVGSCQPTGAEGSGLERLGEALGCTER